LCDEVVGRARRLLCNRAAIDRRPYEEKATAKKTATAIPGATAKATTTPKATANADPSPLKGIRDDNGLVFRVAMNRCGGGHPELTFAVYGAGRVGRDIKMRASE
jgi:hypothetical protein